MKAGDRYVLTIKEGDKQAEHLGADLAGTGGDARDVSAADAPALTARPRTDDGAHRRHYVMYVDYYTHGIAGDQNGISGRGRIFPTGSRRTGPAARNAATIDRRIADGLGTMRSDASPPVLPGYTTPIRISRCSAIRIISIRPRTAVKAGRRGRSVVCPPKTWCTGKITA